MKKVSVKTLKIVKKEIKSFLNALGKDEEIHISTIRKNAINISGIEVSVYIYDDKAWHQDHHQDTVKELSKVVNIERTHECKDLKELNITYFSEALKKEALSEGTREESLYDEYFVIKSSERDKFLEELGERYNTIGINAREAGTFKDSNMSYFGCSDRIS